MASGAAVISELRGPIERDSRTRVPIGTPVHLFWFCPRQSRNCPRVSAFLQSGFPSFRCSVVPMFPRSVVSPYGRFVGMNVSLPDAELSSKHSDNAHHAHNSMTILSVL
jgi:hypothetical protein